MADEEVKPTDPDNNWSFPEEPKEETKQEELPLEASAEETAEADKPEPEPEKPAEDKSDWRDKELKAKHRQIQEMKRLQAEKDAEIAAKDALLAKFNQGKTNETPAVPIDEVDKRVQEKLAEQRYVEQSNKVVAAGEATYKDGWKEAISNLELLGGFDMQTMNGVLATDDPAKVLYELGKNPDRYHSLMGMSLERRIIEMGKIAMAPSQKPVSNAPPPVNPVGGRAAPAKETLRDDYDDDKWYQIRLAQKRAKWSAEHRR